MRRQSGIGYNAPMCLAVHLEEGFSFRGRLPWSPFPKEIDDRWTPELLTEFCEKLRAFAKASRFEEFFARHAELYAGPCGQLEALLKEKADISWFSRFFGVTSPTSFRVMVGMNNGGGNYGSRFIDGGRLEIYSILGIGRVGSDGAPLVSGDVISLLVHEFTHSFANPLIDRHFSELASSAQCLFEHVQPLMVQQAYGEWPIVMRESLVRACVIGYLRDHLQAEAVVQENRQNAERGFVWVEDLARLLERYERDRRSYPTLDEFMPEIVSFFNAWVPKMAELERTRPHVVEMIPANGAVDVSPETKEIRVTFDRPMSSAFAWCGGGDAFPGEGGGNPFWTEDRKTCILPVSLKPNWDYCLSLNALRASGFKSVEGVALLPVEYTFGTALTREQEVVRPRIVSSIPANGDTAVDPGLAAIRVTFSSAMRESCAWCRASGHEFPEIPKGLKSAWQDDHRTCVLPVRLKPGTSYRLVLNAGGLRGFFSRDGIPLKEYPLSFTTRGNP